MSPSPGSHRGGEIRALCRQVNNLPRLCGLPGSQPSAPWQQFPRSAHYGSAQPKRVLRWTILGRVKCGEFMGALSLTSQYPCVITPNDVPLPDLPLVELFLQQFDLVHANLKQLVSVPQVRQVQSQPRRYTALQGSHPQNDGVFWEGLLTISAEYALIALPPIFQQLVHSELRP